MITQGTLRRHRDRLVRFLREEECGSATLWNLFWLVGFGALMGLGIDTTAAMNTKARLQTVADAASHAAVMDVFPVKKDAVEVALRYARQNIPQHDSVVTDTDVTLGFWDGVTGRFNSNGVPFYNAVQVVATRDGARANALATSFLRLVGFDNWDISAVSTSSLFGDLSNVDRCRKNGLHAGGRIDLKANNTVTRDYCLHGEGGFKITQNNLVTCGAELSTPDPSKLIGNSLKTPSGTPPSSCNTNYGGLSNQDMIEQVFVYRSIPSRASLEYATVKKMVEAFIAGTLDNDPFNGVAPYLERVDNVSPATFDAQAESGSLRPGTLYVVFCGGSGKIQPQGLLRNIGIYTDCVIDVRKSTPVSGGGGNGNGNGNSGGSTGNGGGSNGNGNSGGSNGNGNGKNATSTVTATTGSAVTTATAATTAATSAATTAAAAATTAATGAATTATGAIGTVAGAIPPALTCEGALAAGYDRYATFLDTAPGRTYRDGETVDTIAQDCGSEPGASGVWDNVFIFTTAFEDGNTGKTAITFPNDMQVGRVDACTEGGGVRLYSAGGIHSPSGMSIHGSHFIVLGDVKMAAKVSGAYGMTIEATGDISFAAQADMGGCSPDEKDLETDVVLTYRPIAIVH